MEGACDSYDMPFGHPRFLIFPFPIGKVDFTPVSVQRCIAVLPFNRWAGQWFRMDGPREGNAGRMGSQKSSCCDLASEEDQLVEMREDL